MEIIILQMQQNYIELKISKIWNKATTQKNTQLTLLSNRLREFEYQNISSLELLHSWQGELPLYPCAHWWDAFIIGDDVTPCPDEECAWQHLYNTTYNSLFITSLEIPPLKILLLSVN